MKRLAEFFKMIWRRFWRVDGDDRLGLVFGVMLLSGVRERFASQDYALGWFELLFGLLVTILSWYALGKQIKPVVQSEVHP